MMLAVTRYVKHTRAVIDCCFIGCGRRTGLDLLNHWSCFNSPARYMAVLSIIRLGLGTVGEDARGGPGSGPVGSAPKRVRRVDSARGLDSTRLKDNRGSQKGRV